MKKTKRILLSSIFLVSSFFLTSCDSDSLGADISSTISDNLIPNLYSTLAQIAATIILFVCIICFAYKPVKKYLNKRKEYFDNETKDSQAKNSEASKNQLESRVLLANSKNEAKDIIEKAKVEANIQKDEILASADEEAKAKIKDAESVIAKKQETARKEINNMVVDAAVDMSSKILEREVKEEDNQKIIDDFVNELKDKK